MPFIAGLNWFLYLFVDTFNLLSRVRTWLVLVLLYALYGSILYAHYAFLSPIFYEAMAEWVVLVDQVSSWMTGTTVDRAVRFTHFPYHLLLLADYFRWAKLTLALVLEGLVLGVIARAFGDYFMWRREDVQKRMSILSVWPKVTLVWVLINGLMFAVGHFLPSWFEPFLDGPLRVLVFSVVVVPGFFIFIMAVFFFAIPSIAVLGDGVAKSSRRSIRIFRRYPVTCLSLSGVILAGPIIFSVVSMYTSQITNSFDPDIIFWILVAGLSAEVVANYFWMGTAVRFLSERRE